VASDEPAAAEGAGEKPAAAEEGALDPAAAADEAEESAVAAGAAEDSAAAAEAAGDPAAAGAGARRRGMGDDAGGVACRGPRSASGGPVDEDDAALVGSLKGKVSSSKTTWREVSTRRETGS
jgi:hypothetical protein